MNKREYDSAAVYHIRVMGKLDPAWSDWFDGFTIMPLADEQTLLTGSVADQAELHGILAKIRDLCLPLLAVIRQETDHQDTQSPSL